MRRAQLYLTDEVAELISDLRTFDARKRTVEDFLEPLGFSYENYVAYCMAHLTPAVDQKGALPLSPGPYFRHRETLLQMTYAVSAYLKSMSGGLTRPQAEIAAFHAVRGVFGVGLRVDFNQVHFLFRHVHAQSLHLEHCSTCGAQTLRSDVNGANHHRGSCSACWLSKRTARPNLKSRLCGPGKWQNGKLGLPAHTRANWRATAA